MTLRQRPASGSAAVVPPAEAPASANGSSNGVVWDMDTGTSQLRAYNATGYNTELYTSAQAANNRDKLVSQVKDLDYGNGTRLFDAIGESLDALKKLIEKKLADVRSEDQARATLLACIRLAQEFYQDGFYTFTVPKDSVSVLVRDSRLVASGKAVVTKGGKGEITVTLMAGSPPKVAIEGKVRPDVRLR